MTELEPCPFCGGKAKVSVRQMAFYGQNCFGSKKIKFGAQAICNRCYARGPLMRMTSTTADTAIAIAFLTESATEAWNWRTKDV